jgi:2-keto-3-deoxy-6-phosphogluconate aldolase
MENADGVISEAELANLRSVIEFIPVDSKEKKKWLKAIETPNGYLELAPEGNITQEEKERVLSACWSLALCDGIHISSREA